MTELETIREQRDKLLGVTKSMHEAMVIIRAVNNGTPSPLDIHAKEPCPVCKLIAIIEAQIAVESKPTRTTEEV